MAPAVLPPAIGTAVVPLFFPPSRWVDLEECVISVWGASSVPPVLPETPAALFGGMLHAVREKFLTDEDRMTPSGRRILELVGEETRSLEATLVRQRRMSLLPLRSAVGSRTWGDRVRRLQLWAEDVERWPASYRRTSAYADQSAEGVRDLRDAFSVGPEPWWQSVALRLRGRPDEARTSDGELIITDLKTGSPFAASGELRPEIAAQLQLYALMAETLAPGTSVRLFVQHASKQEVVWDEEARAGIRERRARLHDRYPSGARIDAAVEAQPGMHCRRCRIRPRCAKYLTTAPRWWANEPGNPRPLPLDVWGTISEITLGPTIEIVITDAGGRAVHIEGLRPERGWEGVVPGTMLYLFDLEATEDTYRHGVRIHPRNFHEDSPGKPWVTALSTIAFVGP